MQERKFDTISDQELFIQTPFFQEIIKRSIIYLSAGLPIHFVGPTGVGKTSLAIYIAKQLKRPITVLHGNHELSNRDLIGDYIGISKKEVIDNYIHSVYKREQEVKPLWTNGQLTEAVKNGHTLVFDEFTRSHPETNNLFLSVLEEGVLPLYGKHGETPIAVHPQFSVIFTSNPEEYAGVFKTQDALLDRLITIDLDYCDSDTEIQIICQKTGLTLRDAQIITKLVSHFRNYCVAEKRQGPSLRASLMIANIATTSGIPVDVHNKEFQTLCLDVLWLPVFRCQSKMDKQKTKQFILQEVSCF